MKSFTAIFQGLFRICSASGSGNYFCVPNDKSTQYKVENKAKIKTGIVFFKNSKKKKGMSSKYIWISVGKINSM